MVYITEIRRGLSIRTHQTRSRNATLPYNLFQREPTILFLLLSRIRKWDGADGVQYQESGVLAWARHCAPASFFPRSFV
jgi:hypothetical protein